MFFWTLGGQNVPTLPQLDDMCWNNEKSSHALQAEMDATRLVGAIRLVSGLLVK